MKYLNQILVVLIGSLILISCKKNDILPTSLASLNITNAIVGGTAAKLGSNATAISNNSFTQYALVTGSNSLYVYPSADSLHPYYNNSITTNSGDVYSLFLAGNVATTVDAILIQDNIPSHTDSTAGIRFINLSPNSNLLNITQSTTPTVNDVSGLGYKQITTFKSYPGLYNSAYTFQIRDGVTNAILTTVSFTATTVPRFANVTLVIRGTSPGVGVITVKNDR